MIKKLLKNTMVAVLLLGASSVAYATHNRLSGFPNNTEQFFIDRVRQVAQFYFNISLTRNVWLVRDHRETQPVVGQTWPEYFGTNNCWKNYQLRPLGCVESTFISGYVAILHLLPRIVDQYNSGLGSEQQQYRLHRCYFSLPRMVILYVHEASQGRANITTRNNIINKFFEQYNTEIRRQESLRC